MHLCTMVMENLRLASFWHSDFQRANRLEYALKSSKNGAFYDGVLCVISHESYL